jgi:hypothetical protein
MDPTLAEIYGTNEDLEKQAAAELAEELDEEGLELEGLDEDDLEQLASEVLDGEESEDGEEVDDEGQEKLAEADYLGRVMAHSMVSELRDIEKVAARKKTKARAKASGGIGKTLKGWGRSADKGLNKGFDKTLGRAGKAVGRTAKKFWNSGTGKDLRSGAKAVGKHVAKHRGAYTAASIAGGAGYAAKKHFEKKASAFETLAEQRAMELLEENGVETESRYDVLADAVEQRAAEILAENGYEME